MRQAPGPLELVDSEPPLAELRLLIAPEPRSRVFLQNFRDLFRGRASEALHLQSAAAAFWPDVFVDRRLPWRRFLQSGAFHLLAMGGIWAGSRFLALQP